MYPFTWSRVGIWQSAMGPSDFYIFPCAEAPVVVMNIKTLIEQHFKMDVKINTFYFPNGLTQGDRKEPLRLIEDS